MFNLQSTATTLASRLRAVRGEAATLTKVLTDLGYDENGKKQGSLPTNRKKTARHSGNGNGTYRSKPAMAPVHTTSKRQLSKAAKQARSEKIKAGILRKKERDIREAIEAAAKQAPVAASEPTPTTEVAAAATK